MANKGGSLLEDVGRLLAPQTTQGFLNAPLERQTRTRALDQGGALQDIMSAFSNGMQPAQNVSINGQNETVPPLKLSTQSMQGGAPVSGGLPGLNSFMQNDLPTLAFRADPETMLKTFQTRAAMEPLLQGLPPEERRLALMDQKAYAEGKARSMLPSPPEFLTGLKAANIMPGTPQYDAAIKSWTNKQSGQFDAEKFTEEQRHNKATEATSALSDTKDAFGNPIILNKLTGETKNPGGVQAVGPEAVESTADMIGQYKRRPPTGAAGRSPFNLAVMDAVAKKYPDYNEQFYNSSNSARTKFASGKEGSQVRSANVALSHVMTLEALGNALDNGDVQLANKLKNALSDQFGGQSIASYEAAAPLVGDEVAKFVLGGGSALADREKFASPLSSARGTPQRTAALNSFKALLVGQLHGYKRQYENETKSKDFGEKLDPEVAKLLENPQFAPGTNPNAAQPPAGAPQGAKQGNDGGWYTPDPARPGKYLKWQ